MAKKTTIKILEGDKLLLAEKLTEELIAGMKDVDVFTPVASWRENLTVRYEIDGYRKVDLILEEYERLRGYVKKKHVCNLFNVNNVKIIPSKEGSHAINFEILNKNLPNSRYDDGSFSKDNSSWHRINVPIKAHPYGGFNNSIILGGDISYWQNVDEDTKCAFEHRFDKKDDKNIYELPVADYTIGINNKSTITVEEHGISSIKTSKNIVTKETENGIILSVILSSLKYDSNKDITFAEHIPESVSYLSIDGTLNFRRYRGRFREVESSTENMDLATKTNVYIFLFFNKEGKQENMYQFLASDSSRKFGLFEFAKWLPAMKYNKDEMALITILQLMMDNERIESIIKTGMKGLIISVLNNIFAAQNKKIRREKMEEVSSLFYINDKGKQVFRIPPHYIALMDALGVEYEKYNLWADFAEKTRMDKNQLTNFADSAEFITMINNPMWKLPNVLSYDVDVIKLIKYINKQSDKRGMPYSLLLSNYLDYCEMSTRKIGKDFNRFPSDLVKAHDEVSKIRTSLVTGKYDSQIKALKEKYFKDFAFLKEKYTIIMPECEDDVLKEAINQNNCLADYVERIGKHETVIFFIRQSEAPKQSFVTAQIDFNGNLIQIRRRNELPVEDPEILELANMFARHVKVQAHKIS